MPNNELVNITNCHENCERLFEAERERDELKAERDTWAISAEICSEHPVPTGYAGLPHDSGTFNVCGLAAAYALAEAYGEEWREAMEAK